MTAFKALSPKEREAVWQLVADPKFGGSADTLALEAGEAAAYFSYLEDAEDSRVSWRVFIVRDAR